MAIVSPFNEKVAGSNPPGNFNFSFFSLPNVYRNSTDIKERNVHLLSPTSPVVLGAVAQYLETVIASSNLGSRTEGLGHYGLGTAPYLP